MVTSGSKKQDGDGPNATQGFKKMSPQTNVWHYDCDVPYTACFSCSVTVGGDKLLESNMKKYFTLYMNQRFRFLTDETPSHRWQVCTAFPAAACAISSRAKHSLLFRAATERQKYALSQHSECDTDTMM